MITKHDTMFKNHSLIHTQNVILIHTKRNVFSSKQTSQYAITQCTDV